MPINPKPSTKYSGLVFSDNKFLRFVPVGLTFPPGETMIVQDSVFVVLPNDSNTTKEGFYYTGRDLDNGAWYSGGWATNGLFQYYTGNFGGRVTNGFKDKATVGIFVAGTQIGLEEWQYFRSLYQMGRSSKYGLFIDNISTVDGSTTMQQAISQYPDKAWYGVLNTSKLADGGFADFIVYMPNGYLGGLAGPALTDETILEYFPKSLKETPGVYEEGGTSTEDGGDGDFDNTSVPIEIPPLPTISAASTGFISLFNPSLSQLNELASYLWSDLFEIDGWKKLFANPMDSILGLSILPVTIPSGGSREVKVGNIGTGISLTVASTQFVEVDCGSINVNEYWGAYLDYEPYTQAQIFLPYIGTRPISVDDIMGKTVRVVYHVDILTGACCCFVKCGESVLYTYNGQCSIPIPVNSANYTSVVNGVISIAASVGSLVATGGASAPTAIPSIANSAVNQMKPQIEKSGSISGSAGVLNMQIPYLILIRPRQALPSKQNEFIGYPSLITVQLTELTGYTEVQSIHLENIPATQEELAEIQSLLEGGVIF